MERNLKVQPLPLSPKAPSLEESPVRRRQPVLRLRNILLIAAFLSLIYGLVWTYSTDRYLKGFADAIVPLQGSPEQKTEALLKWFRHEPERADATVEGITNLRDPVNIVQNARLLKICGSASNAFINLAAAAGLNTRRLLLLDRTGGTMHVVVEVLWGDRWIVVDPVFSHVFRDHSGRPLTKEELSNPKVFRDAIRRMPRYSRTYTFAHTDYVHLERLPVLGGWLRQALNRFSPGWEEAYDWGYIPENPSLWPILLSFPLLVLGILARWIGDLHAPVPDVARVSRQWSAPGQEAVPREAKDADSAEYDAASVSRP